MGGRVVVYALAVGAVPAVWRLVRAARPGAGAYPYALDVFVMAPFVLDATSQALGVEGAAWWPYARRFAAWTFLVAAFGQVLVRLRLGRPEVAGLAVGFGAVTAILWELAEHYTLHREVGDPEALYVKTLADLALALAASLLGAAATVTLLWRGRGRETTRLPPRGG